MEVGDGGFSVVFVEELSASKERERERKTVSVRTRSV